MLRRIRRAIQDYFGFNPTETRAFLLLMLVVVVALLLPFAFDYWPSSLPDTTKADQQKLDSLVAGLQIRQKEARPNRYARRGADRDSEPEADAPPARLFAFDPNQISAQQWQQLGLPRWLGERIVKYRTKGGQFRKKEDLKKIYDFPAETYERLEPYIQLPGTTTSVGKFNESDVTAPTIELPKPAPSEPKFAAKVPFTFDLNAGDTTEFKRIYGIGSKLSVRIIKYRESLGGFYAENQIRDVWGLDSSVVDELFKHATLRSPQVRKLNVNAASLEQLKHPYLKPYVAKAIIAYRQQHGPYGSATELSNVKVLDGKTLEKLTPYLEF
ncbi:MAG: helix-hairpin-helix domain-containing protein [Cytophagaceae bacterium]|nr:helix-hairpin-helix domain-containing protein [Cytophagaceae bacterium]